MYRVDQGSTELDSWLLQQEVGLGQRGCRDRDGHWVDRQQYLAAHLMKLLLYDSSVLGIIPHDPILCGHKICLRKKLGFLMMGGLLQPHRHGQLAISTFLPVQLWNANKNPDMRKAGTRDPVASRQGSSCHRSDERTLSCRRQGSPLAKQWETVCAPPRPSLCPPLYCVQVALRTT